MPLNGVYVHRHLKRLRTLKLGNGIFKGEGLRVLTALTALRSLSLDSCSNLTDEGLRSVVAPLSLHSLADVNVFGCTRLTRLSSVSQPQITSHSHDTMSRSLRSLRSSRPSML